MASRAGPVIIQLIITYFIIAVIVRAIRRARKPAQPPAEPNSHPASVPDPTLPPLRPSSPPPRSGGFRREQRMYNGVVWQMVHRPLRDLSQTTGPRTSVDEVYVEEPPRCPKCGLGVIETHSWLGYRWACPECGTRSRSQSSIEETARMLARQR